MLVYPDGRIQAAGAHRNLGAPEWFDHRYRFKRPDHGPANVPDTALAVTGAGMYLRRSLIDELGDSTTSFPMAYEDVDYCLRAWEAGWHVRYEPAPGLPTSSRPPAAPRSASASAAPRSTSGTSGATGSTAARCATPTAASGSST